MPAVLMVGEVAGVARRLSQLVDDDPAWSAIQIDAPGYGARAPRPIKMALLPLRAVQLAAKTWLACRRHQPDLVHLHWARLAPFVSTGAAPLVVHAHGTDVRDGLGNGLTKSIVRRSMARADVRIAATPDLLRSADGRAEYLPNVVDTDRFAPPDRQTDAEPLTILIFARLSAIKGADTILDAIEKSNRASGCTLIAIRSGAEFESRAQQQGITLIDAVDHDDLPAVLHAASIVIGQQHLGALGLSELEAMACGRPVLARVEGGLYSSMPPVVTSSDSDELATHIDGLVSRGDERGAVAGAGRRWVVEHHSPDAVRRQLLQIYDTALAGTGHQGA